MAQGVQLGMFGRPPETVELPDVCRTKHKGNPRSEEANRRIEPYKVTLRERVRIFVAACENYGATCKEIAEKFSTPMHSISGRISELKADGLVFDSGRTRDGGAVLVGNRNFCNGSAK